MDEERRPKSFHERFDIEVGADEAKQRFLNRASNIIFYRFMIGNLSLDVRRALLEEAASALGKIYDYNKGYSDYIAGDFHSCLQVLETVYQALEGTNVEHDLSSRIEQVVHQSEIDLGIRWQPPVFVPAGARLLDERLVNDPLRWLSAPEYRTVYEPFQKGLSHFVESQKRAQLLADVITDMYEALAKIVTGRMGRDPSANREAFISRVGASDHYKKLLKEYVAYANEFRHAEREAGTRPVPSRAEAESFMYLTGIFIRLAVQD